MFRRRAFAALAASLLVGTALTGCVTGTSAVIDDSVVSVGLDEPVTGQVPASPLATVADLALGTATLAGFSYLDDEGTTVPDPGFGVAAVVAEDPFTVRYTVADGLAWSDGVGIDGVDLLLDWAARSTDHAARFGASPDPALAAASEARLSGDRKSLDVTFTRTTRDWQDAFRAPLPAHVLAERAFGSADPQFAKDAVIAAVESAAAGRTRDLGRLAAAWSTAFDPAQDALPASGPYRIASMVGTVVELAANATYAGPRQPVYETLVLHTAMAPTAATQALSIGKLDVVQVAWSEEIRNVMTRIGLDRAVLPTSDDPTTLVGWDRRRVVGVEPGATRLGALWNPWAWAPFTVAEIGTADGQ